MYEQKLNKPATPIVQIRKLLLPLSFLGLLFFNLPPPILAQGNALCNGVQVRGVFNDDPNSDYFQGIIIENLSAPYQIIKIYNSNWERIEECSGDCTALTSYETEAGKYFVQIQFYNENWGWICQTDNIEVTVPESSNSAVSCDDFAYTLSPIYFEDGQNRADFELTFNTPSGQVTNVDISNRNTGEILFTCGVDCGNKVAYTATPGAYVVNYSRINPEEPNSGCSDIIYFQVTEECQDIKARGVYNLSADNQTISQGIEISIPPSRVNVVAKIYDSNQGFIEQIGGMSSLFYDTDAGRYFVVVELYTIPRIFGEERRLICQTDFLPVRVSGSDCDIAIINGVFPASVKPGETINLEATLQNFSTIAASNSTVGLYQLKGGNNFFPSPRLIAETPIAFLAPGETKTFYFSATLPDPLWNVPFFPIGEESLSNNFVLLTKENANAVDAVNCKYPVDFTIDYPDVDLALSLENNQGCIDAEGFLLTDLKVTNLSSRTAKAPIYVDLAKNCSFGNPDIATCKVHITNNRAYVILQEDLAPNQSIIINKPYKLPSTNFTEWTITAKVDALGSSIDDPNEDNNSVTTTFIRTENCGGSNPTPDCNKVAVTATPSGELQGTIQITGLTAPIEIVKIYTDRWQLVYECSANCEDPIIYPAEVGKYIVQVQMYDENWKWICQTDNIEVEVELNTDCAANLLRDEDGDGVCEGVDCDDNDPNIGAKQAPGTTCDDGDPTTREDVIQEDGCTCQGIPDIGNPSCEDVSIVKVESFAPTPGVALYAINGLTAPIEIVKIFNRRTYEKLFECNNDCGVGFDVELQEGEYVLQIQMYTATWGWICGKDIEFDAITGDPGPVNCSNIVVNISDPKTNPFINNGDPHVEVKVTPNNGLNEVTNVTISRVGSGEIVYTCGLDCPPTIDLFLKEGDYALDITKSLKDGSASCSLDIIFISVPGSNQSPDCNKVRTNFFVGITDAYEGLGVEGLNAPIEIVKIYDANWNRVYECAGNCDNPTVLPLSDLSPGLYRVQVQMFTADWQSICETDYLEVIVPEDAGSRSGEAFIDDKAITLFPNPVQHTLKLKTTPFQGKKGRIQIFNTFGQQIAEIPQKKFNQTYETIDVSTYQNGLYFMSIKVENQRAMEKRFLVEKLE